MDDICDLRFRLYDDPSEGAQVGPDVQHLALPVQQGLFHAPLDFGRAHFNGEVRWLEVAVRCPAGAGTYTPLSPRQDLTPRPLRPGAPGAADLAQPGYLQRDRRLLGQHRH